MSNIKKLMMSAAGGGEALNVEDVFSTYLFRGNGTSQTITNGLDLDGEGGFIWTKRRDASAAHQLYDTARGVDYMLNIVNDAGQYDYTGDITSLNSDGFTVGYYSGGLNYLDRDYATWTFRKAPKFFDVVTYTGNGSAGRSISHNLGTTVGMLVVKRTNNQGGWHTWHRSDPNKAFRLDTIAEGSSANAPYYFGNNSNVIAPTSTTFTVASNAEVNNSGDEYVAYLFAHNDGDGEFGPTGDQDIIKCGSWTASSTAAVSVDLGFEPQWVLIKRAPGSQDWLLWDTMRGMPVDSGQPYLRPNSNGAESTDTYYLSPTPTGFTVRQNALGNNGDTYIYIAIRRGTKVPESGTEVFAAAYQNSVNTSPGWTSGFPVDMSLDKNIGGGSTDEWNVGSRLTQGKYFYKIDTASEGAASSWSYDFMDGWREFANNGPSDFSWMWKRAPGFFDVVAYPGFLSVAGTGTIPHGLSVAPELMIFKSRTNFYGWYTWHKDLTANHFLQLNSNAAEVNFGPAWATADENNINIGFGHATTSLTGQNYIAFLFATLPGISKVGSYTGNSSTQTIDCGFTNGARFVLIKSYNDSGDWQVFDTVRGIVSGDDGRLLLNRTDAETNDDYIDPHPSGFSLPNHAFTNSNAQGQKYIFYAIA